MKKPTKTSRVLDALTQHGVQTIADLITNLHAAGDTWANKRNTVSFITSLRNQGVVTIAGRRPGRKQGSGERLYALTGVPHVRTRRPYPTALSTQTRLALQEITEGTLVEVAAELQRRGMAHTRREVSSALYSLHHQGVIERVCDVPHPESVTGKKMTPLYRTKDREDWRPEERGAWSFPQGVDRPALPCFPSEEDWREYCEAFAMHPSRGGFCADCTDEYKQKMISKRLCERHEGEQ